MDSNVEQGTMQLVMDQLEELAVTLIEEIRERPGVFAAILAAVVGAFVGSMLASRRQSVPPPKKLAQTAKGMVEAGDLAAIGVKLLQNPIVRGYLSAALQGQLKKRFSL
jgi:uncharacterized membrane protein YeaQ/YmgE (transglycosylase-associated protein family)